MRLRWKALALFVPLTILPAAATALTLYPKYLASVSAAEDRTQQAIISDTVRLIDTHITRVTRDALVLAAALGYAASSGTDAGLDAAKGILAQRSTLDVARLEIPSKNLNLTFGKSENDPASAPSSTEALRAKALERGAAIAFIGGRDGILVVPIPRPESAKDAAQGFLTVPIHLQPLVLDLEALRDAQFSGLGEIAVVDEERRVVVALGRDALSTGDDAGGLTFFRALPDGAIPAEGFVRQEIDHQGTRYVATIGTSGSGETVGTTRFDYLRWFVGISRPKDVVYAEAYELRRTVGIVLAIVTALGLLLAELTTRAVTGPVVSLLKQARIIGQRAWRSVSAPDKRRDEIGDLSRGIAQMATDLEAQEIEIAREVKRRADLSRYMSQELVDNIIAGNQSLELGGERTPVTVLFADVVAFTPLAETRKPEEVVALLNELFSVLTEVVFRHHGVVDKFVGDCIMAVWGAPVERKDHAGLALAAAEDMMRFLETASEAWKARYDVEIRLGIGVNSGEAIVGNIGSDKRMEYTVIGDVVNVAARLESIAQPNQVLVGETTAALVEEAGLRKLGHRRLTGKKTDTLVYELEVG